MSLARPRLGEVFRSPVVFSALFPGAGEREGEGRDTD